VLEVEGQVVLVGEADGAVDLNRLGGDTPEPLVDQGLGPAWAIALLRPRVFQRRFL
jgi:hypothetical protein